MRLFVEEKRSGTIEMLFTSPVRDLEIILGKWFGALLLYLAILAVSLVELVIFRWPDLDSRVLAAAYVALISQGAGLLAVGECISMCTRHESVAASGTLLVCMAVLSYHSSGVLKSTDLALCAALMTGGWLLTRRSIQALRGTF